MKNISLTLLAVTAIGAISIGGASAMPFNTLPPTLGESSVQDVRLVCDQNGRCYNTRRSYRSTRGYYAPRYSGRPAYYGAPSYYSTPGYGYYSAPRVGVGVGPFGVGIF
jgi:hypothetical protein